MLLPVQAPLALAWLALASLLGFAAMGIDKMLAAGRRRTRSRISEKALWMTALVGGFVGVFLGGLLFHHKTSKPEFWVPVLLSAILWTIVLGFALPRLTLGSLGP